MPRQQSKTGNERLARLIRERREALRLSRRDLAERTGLSYPYISQLETAYRLPSPKAMQVLARSLGVPSRDLYEALPGDGEPAGAVDFQAPLQAAATQWIANPTHHRLAEQLPPAPSGDAVRAAITALEGLPPDSRLEALATVQAAVLAGIVRHQAGTSTS